MWEEQRLGGCAKAHTGWVEVELRDEHDCTEHTDLWCLFLPCVVQTGAGVLCDLWHISDVWALLSHPFIPDQ